MSRQKDSSIFFLLFSNFLNVFGWALLTPLYALYATKLGASPQEVAFTWSFYTLLAGILMIVLGWLEDHLPKKVRLLTIGYVVQTVGVGILFCAANLHWLMAGLGVYAIGTAIVMPVWKLLYARKEHRGKEATGWGIFHGLNTLLISAAAAAGGVIFTAFGFKGILGFMLVAHALATVVSIGARTDSRSR
jgi:MFS family permease